MPFFDTGDHICAIGLVAVWFAQLEDVLDEVIRQSAPVIPPDPNIERKKFRFSAKVDFLEQGFRDAFAAYPYSDAAYADQDRDHVTWVLQNCKAIAKDRNDILHRPISSNPHTNTTLQKCRDGQMQQIASQDIIDLANDIHALHGHVLKLTFVLGRLLEAKQAAAPRA